MDIWHSSFYWFHHLMLEVSEAVSGKMEQEWSLEWIIGELAQAEGQQRNFPG